MTLGAPQRAGAWPEADPARRAIPFDHRVVIQVRHADRDVTLKETLEVSVEAELVVVSMAYALVPETPRTAFGVEAAEDLDAPLAAAPIPLAAPLGPPGPVPAQVALFDAAVAAAAAARRNALPARSAPGRPPADRPRLADLPEADRAAAAQRARQALAAIPPRAFTIGDLLRALSRRLGEGDLADRGLVGPRTASALDAGLRLRPEAARAFLLEGGYAPLDPALRATLFEVEELPPQGIQFLYALHDQGTGRSFQNEPILSTAGLGEEHGGRPFRTFTPPLRFAPRSTLRLEVTPRSAFAGELHFVLHGFKVLGGAQTPTGRLLRRRRRRVR